MAGGRSLARVIAGPSASSNGWSPRRWFEHWLLQGCHRIVASHAAEQAECLAQGFMPEQVALVPPGINAVSQRSKEPLPACLEQPGTRWIVCAGRLDFHEGLRAAFWAVDILCFLYKRLHLLVLGDGPDREVVADFARKLYAHDRVHVLGDRADAAELMSRAELVWAPVAADGARVALSAMAAGRPVVAVDHPALAEIVTAETGLLVPKNESPGLARQTRELLEDPARARRMGEAGRRRAREHFSARRFADELLRVYYDTAIQPRELLRAA
jgi:glycosyltransferase involved in cell wall biosynthesis